MQVSFSLDLRFSLWLGLNLVCETGGKSHSNAFKALICPVCTRNRFPQTIEIVAISVIDNKLMREAGEY